MPQVKVIVTLKPTLLDAQGRVVKEALHSLGYTEVEQVRMGKYLELQVDAQEANDRRVLENRIREMCDRLLANPVTEDYRFEIEEVPV
ncbi:phosphoribosylformylglycinamidine synthase, purS protein [Chthonomonas calidirosea]|uniref:Phosphoribosylformylglycinamidine synthase subunit PurS n=1 Tax=Chthonomonas calidirosea (strain DSM 23976 / ICMP 18418 / T49) TaxID=1303518 RepID=S0EW42_CHTCT|nr:phosphoribosylformylglycinamidine synthase subunit PurS [Chthonomonas calidirosea]CCW34612.1 phosphoribosylformylglycinamidine synthase, purS protein [Chthonomonas calidirosea T49]CEK13102.1 phosphoribosylformylglycinamidine synthase, purS protein [Chthonomonas calidirosea]CEK13107.1 phosphoribosylformylglycinamidine synthase, purS protein [Chthonomonas calidirosea]CEK14285.1 phosphoribosylformylglycinamidine synthase, purS protein [Chthonomonas calidirosea]